MVGVELVVEGIVVVHGVVVHGVVVSGVVVHGKSYGLVHLGVACAVKMSIT